MEILNNRKIDWMIKRLGVQILENHYKEDKIILAGINNNGFYFAELLSTSMRAISDIPIQLCRIRLQPAAPLREEVSIDVPTSDLESATVIIVDDVANTGRTLFYAFKIFERIIPKRVEVAVLVDRKHKSFPIDVKYVGLSLVTTLSDNITVSLKTKKKKVVLD